MPRLVLALAVAFIGFGPISGAPAFADEESSQACDTIVHATDPSKVTADVVRLCNTNEYFCKRTLSLLWNPDRKVPGLDCGLRPEEMQHVVLDTACTELTVEVAFTRMPGKPAGNQDFTQDQVARWISLCEQNATNDMCETTDQLYWSLTGKKLLKCPPWQR